jgi:hypothetical protein
MILTLAGAMERATGIGPASAQRRPSGRISSQEAIKVLPGFTSRRARTVWLRSVSVENPGQQPDEPTFWRELAAHDAHGWGA